MDEFFGRIYKQDTVSSKAHHHAVERYVSPTNNKQSQSVVETTDKEVKLYLGTNSTQQEIALTSSHSTLRKSLLNYQKKKLSAKTCASDILEMLWTRDSNAILKKEMGWEVYPVVVEESRDEVGVWNGEFCVVIIFCA